MTSKDSPDEKRQEHAPSDGEAHDKRLGKRRKPQRVPSIEAMLTRNSHGERTYGTDAKMLRLDPKRITDLGKTTNLQSLRSNAYSRQ